MDRTGSAGFRSVSSTKRSREVDRTTWAGEVTETVVWETVGSGNTVTSEIAFKNLFEGEPSFYYGVEVGEGLTLVEGDYPFVSAGVAEWGVVQATVDGRANYYRSATVWMVVDATTEYTLRWTFAFSGTVMRNREHVGG